MNLQSFRSSFYVLFLLVFAGCKNPFSSEVAEERAVSSELDSVVVVTIDGKPVAHGKDFDRHLTVIFDSQPGLKDVLGYLSPEQQSQFYESVAENLLLTNVMSKWLEESGIKHTVEYQERARLAHEALDQNLASHALEQETLKHVSVSDEEAESFYNANKTTDPMFQRPPFLVKQAGFNARGLNVDSQKAAQELVKNAEATSYTAAAQHAKRKVVDYGVVDSSSSIDSAVRDAILNVKKFPTVEAVRGSDKKWRVVEVTRKQDAEYAPYDQVQDAVKQMFTNKKFHEHFQARLNEMKDRYKATVNKEFLEKRVPKAPEKPLPVEPEAEEPTEESSKDIE